MQDFFDFYHLLSLTLLVVITERQWIDVGLDFDVLFNAEELDYFHAMEQCRTLGGQLFEPKNLEEQAIISDLIMDQLQWTWFWIGVNDFKREGR